MRKLGVLIILFCQSCIGTDILEDPIMEPRIVITTMLRSIEVGEQFQLSAEYFDEFGLLQNVMVQWISTENAVLTISESGLVTAVGAGESMIIAQSEGVSDTIFVTAGQETIVDSNLRSGAFRGSSGYNVAGTVTLGNNDNDQTELMFAENFTAEQGPGLYIYLSNSPNSAAGGYEVGMLTSNNGMQTYILPQEVSPSAFDYVLIFCKPFNVTFGYAELN